MESTSGKNQSTQKGFERRKIRKVAVLGAGIMGSRIACHFANIGLDVLLLDIAPKELNDKEKAKGLDLNNPTVKNRIVNTAFTSTLKTKPASLYEKSFINRVTLGNFEDNMKDISDCDWVIEVVVERLDIKKIVFAQVEKYRKKGSIISSNTSGIPIHMMLEDRSEDFQEHFCGAHFFNPPRYLRLLEIIPSPKTKPEVIDFLMEYGDMYLGKTTVLCKDTPAFIANRVGVFAILSALHSIEEMGLTVEEVDKLTGPLIGRAKSATFRTMDVVGLDTLIHVANGLVDNVPNDEAKDKFALPKSLAFLQKKGWLGDKSKQGFYKKTKDENGKKQILALDLKTLEYKPKEKVKLDAVAAVKNIDILKDRFPILCKAKDKAGDFYRKTFSDLFAYVTHRIPEISDTLYSIDDAICAGFGWKLGPFATWDAIGLEEGLKMMEASGAKSAAWINEMVASGAKSFYKVENGARMYYDVVSKEYKTIPGVENFIILENKASDLVWNNAGSSIYDLGDGILGLEFHTKMNALGPDPIQGINHAIQMAEDNYRGLVISGRGDNFSAGANLAMLFMYAVEQDFDEVNMMVAQFQNTMMKVRYSGIPVVTATHGMALGGGCEINLHADAIQALAETYMGLVEVGVGLIPGGGGTKEMALRVSDAYQQGDVVYNELQEAFMNIAMAKVATSAEEARSMGYIRSKDKVSISDRRLLGDAKLAAITLAENGYVQKRKRTDITVQGVGGLALFKAGVTGMRYGNYISDHDMKIADKLAYVICGGDLSYPQKVSEQYLLDLEREAFLSLCGEQKTLERIQSILTTGRPLRN